MALRELPANPDDNNGDEEEDEEEDDPYYRELKRRYRQQYKEPKIEHEWVFLDEFGTERFRHDGDTIVPGAGVRWQHVHPKPPTVQAASSSGEDRSGACSAIAEIKGDDEEELPWQVIAILDEETVEQLLWGSMHRKEKVRKAKEGKNAPAPSRASLESCFAPGRWLFRVVAPEVTLHVTPDDTAQQLGKRQRGDYIRVVRLGTGGN